MNLGIRYDPFTISFNDYHSFGRTRNAKVTSKANGKGFSSLHQRQLSITCNAG